MAGVVVRTCRRAFRLFVPSFIRHIIEAIVSAVIINAFLTILLVFALCNNLVIHLYDRLDFRDTRGSWTSIIPRLHASIKHRRRSQKPKPTVEEDVDGGLGRVPSSNSTSSLLSLDDDVANNIEYDHTITRPETRPSASQDIQLTTADFKSFINLESDQEALSSSNQREGEDLVCDLGYYYEHYGIEVETIKVETDDGFIIDLWHLKDMKTTNTHKKYPFLLVHGLLQSSGSFATSGKSSLAYYLHQSGFDVWLGNNRSGFNPAWNESKVPKNDKWNWDMVHMVKYDIKALVETVLSRTGFEKLTMVGHSQGTTQIFMGLVNGEAIYGNGFRLKDKLDNFVALAPAVYPGPLLEDKAFLYFISKGIDNKVIFGAKSFVPIMMFMKQFIERKLFTFLSYTMFNYLFDWNDSLWDKSLRGRHFMFSPVHISVKLMQWWLSPDPNKISFKTGAEFYFPDERTWFPIANEKPVQEPMALHMNDYKERKEEFPRILLFIPRQDRLVDGERLINHFINHEAHSLFKIWYIDEYSHMDVLWAQDIIQRIGRPMLKNLRLTEEPRNLVEGTLASVKEQPILEESKAHKENENSATNAEDMMMESKVTKILDIAVEESTHPLIAAETLVTI